MRAAADLIDAHLDGMLTGRSAAVQSASVRSYQVSVQRPDGTAENYQRHGGSSIDHTQEAMELAGLGGLVRVVQLDQAGA
jgi:hypothetical protein